MTKQSSSQVDFKCDMSVILALERLWQEDYRTLSSKLVEFHNQTLCHGSFDIRSMSESQEKRCGKD